MSFLLAVSWRLTRRILKILAWTSAGAMLLWLLIRPAKQPDHDWGRVTDASGECVACLSAATMSLSGPLNGRGSAEFELLHDPTLDDAISHWSSCVQAITGCFRDRLDMPECVRASPCPTDCKDTYDAERLRAGIGGQDLTAFYRVFVGQGESCVPKP